MIIVVELADDMRPTVVYNCAKVPALCKTAQKYLNHNGALATTGSFHYDMTGHGRSNTRRENSGCVTAWIDIPIVAGRNRCPEIDQPDYLTNGSPLVPIKVNMHFKNVRDAQGNNVEVPDVRDMGRLRNGLSTNGLRSSYSTGTSLTCDEFPPARYVCRCSR